MPLSRIGQFGNVEQVGAVDKELTSATDHGYPSLPVVAEPLIEGHFIQGHEIPHGLARIPSPADDRNALPAQDGANDVVTPKAGMAANIDILGEETADAIDWLGRACRIRLGRRGRAVPASDRRTAGRASAAAARS